MVDTSQQPALGYMEVVPTRDAATLLPIMWQHVADGSIVWSDMWTTYNGIQLLPIVSNHDTVNHSVEFINRATGVHTQHIDSYWNRVKIKLKRMHGCNESKLP